MLIISKDDKKLIISFYKEGFPIKEIASAMKMSVQDVMFVLCTGVDDIDVERLFIYDNLDDKKVLVLSDTHIGSVYENLDYIREAYRIAREEGIHTIIHGGDLMQSTYTNVSPMYINCSNQIGHVINDYPYDDSITNYIVLGNHDYHTISKDPKYMEMLDERDDFSIMGFKKAYLKWNGRTISVSHLTKKYPYCVPSLKTDMNFRGHSHRFNCSDSNIVIPTASDDLLQLQNERPGFIVASNNGSVMEFDSYYFDADSLNKRPKVFRKKL